MPQLVGITGILVSSSRVVGCSNTGKISGNGNCNGIVGQNRVGENAVENCRNDYSGE